MVTARQHAFDLRGIEITNQHARSVVRECVWLTVVVALEYEADLAVADRQSGDRAGAHRGFYPAPFGLAHRDIESDHVLHADSPSFA
jgi:hypothetical protein